MHDRFGMNGKTVLVTGGGRGLGERLARIFAEAGAAVAVGSRKRANCEAVAAAIAKAGGRALALSLDVADEASIRAALAATRDGLGGLDVLVNNAGATWGAPAHEHPAAAYDKVMGVNLRGAFLASREAAAGWIAAGRGGTILNVSSVAGLKGTPAEFMDAAAYSASKAGLIGLTRDLAVKWAQHGIRVNAIAPGFFPTDMSQVTIERGGADLLREVPMRRFGGEDELSGAALLLCSDAGSYITGQVLAVDGGMSAR